MKAISTILTVLLFVSCQENIESSREYSWSTSELIPYFDAIHKFKIADGTSLYISGTVNGIPGIFKLDGNKWTKVIETYGFADDFIVYKGVLYFGNSYGLYRVVNSIAEKFTTNDPQIIAMDVFEDKLFITGGSILIDGKYYTTASFDGSNFTPISEYISGYSMLVANDKLFIGNYPVTEFGNTGIKYLDIGGQSNMTTDSDGNIYIASITVNAKNKIQSTIQKYTNGESLILGDTLNCYVHKIQFYNGTIVISGSEDLNEGISYYYKNGNWRKIEIPFPSLGGTNILGDMILYNGKIIGSPLISGKVLELK
jgi:hypothetical protein